MARTSSNSKPRRAANDSAPEDVLSFMRLMWAVDHALQRTSKQMNRSIGLTGPQRLVVRLLGRTPGMSAGQLAAELHLDPSTLTGILQRLEGRRLVQRQKDPTDARRLRLTLTARGASFNAPSPGTIEAALMRAMEGRPTREIKAARSLLTSIAEELAAAPDHLQRAGRRRGSRAPRSARRA
jgi:DNA-binding MarR family transcriptional regulator